MEYRLKMYERAVDYNGRLVVLVSDPDQIVFVNGRSIKWDGVTPLTVDEIIPFLKFYGREVKKPKEQSTIQYPVAFVDGEGMHYGEDIRFDDNGDPIITVIDGCIKSTYIKCECEKLIIANAYAGTMIEYYKFSHTLNRCPFLKKSSGFITNTYKCKLCGDVWKRKRFFPGDYPAGCQTVNSKWKRYQ